MTDDHFVIGSRYRTKVPNDHTPEFFSVVGRTATLVTFIDHLASSGTLNVLVLQRLLREQVIERLPPTLDELIREGAINAEEAVRAAFAPATADTSDRVRHALKRFKVCQAYLPGGRSFVDVTGFEEILCKTCDTPAWWHDVYALDDQARQHREALATCDEFGYDGHERLYKWLEHTLAELSRLRAPLYRTVSPADRARTSEADLLTLDRYRTLLLSYGITFDDDERPPLNAARVLLSSAFVKHSVYYLPGLDELAERIGVWRHLKQFITDLHNLEGKLLLCHSEISEASDELRDALYDEHNTLVEVRPLYLRRDGKPMGFESEIADLQIRLLDIANAIHMDLAGHVALKMLFNETRPAKHGRKSST